jgi:hypothetical protein
MLLAGLLSGLFALVWLGGTFWVLRRVGALKRSSFVILRRRGLGVAGEASIHIPTWVGELRYGDRSPTTVPFLVTVLGLVGFAYSVTGMLVFSAVAVGNIIIAVLLVAGLLYITAKIGLLLIESLRIARAVRAGTADATSVK